MRSMQHWFRCKTPIIVTAGVLLKQLVPEAHGFSLTDADAGDPQPITCHVLDSARGKPAAGLKVQLFRCEEGSRCAASATHLLPAPSAAHGAHLPELKAPKSCTLHDGGDVCFCA
jgi:HIUase/Transthyretin family